jgi:hypothetical protein
MSAAPSAAGSPWIQGRASDLLLGTGILYLPFFALSLLVGPQLLIGSIAVVPFLILLFANAHLGATLVRVYSRPEDRRAYRLFSVWASLCVAGLVLVGLWVPLIGSVLLTFYLTVVPWHFTGQNYGVSLVFLRRRGIEVTPELKRYLWLSFFLSYVLWILALHSAQPGTVDYAPLRLQGTQYSFLALGIPAPVVPYLLSVVGIVYVWAIAEVASRLVGRAPLRELAPTFLLMLSQGLWFSAPVIGRYFFEPEQLGPLAGLWAPWNAGSTFLVVSLMHSLQYLWITDYYVRKEQGTTTSSFLGRSLLAGMAIFGLPFVLLLPQLGGGPSYEAGLYLMLSGALNIQHVMLDGVIWKLRNTRIASILIAGQDAAAAAGAIAVPRRRWLGKAVFASGVIGLALAAASEVEHQVGLNPALESDDPAPLEASLERLVWMGRDSSIARNRLAALKYKAGDAEEALEEYRRSLALRPRAETYLGMGRILEQEGRVAEALSAYDEALALEPDDVDALVATSRASYKAGQAARAEHLLARAAELDPDNHSIRVVLEALQKGQVVGAPN